MPIHLLPLSRRSFVGSAAAALAGAVPGAGLFRRMTGAPERNRFALLSDTHIAATPDQIERGSSMAANLQQVVGDILRDGALPEAVFINGDCSFATGSAAEYAAFASGIAPLVAQRLPLHLTLGNHDNRDAFFAAFPAQRARAAPVVSKQVGIVESRHVNWFLLDSLIATGTIPGALGERQIAWLARSLDQHREKPAIVMVHHNPEFAPGADGSWIGLQDSAALFEMLARRPQVQAVFYGHTHVWQVDRRDRFHLINLPAVSYTFEPGPPLGWVDARARANGIDLVLHTLDATDARSGQHVALEWQGR